jgi:nucleotide-binding universal stress UspA family protein
VTFSALMACLRLGRSNAALLGVTAALAERFQASVIGVATRQPMQFMFSAGPVPEELIAQDEEGFEDEAESLEAEFRNALIGRARDLHWRAKMEFGRLSEYIANEARSADLVITEFDRGGSLSDPSTGFDVGDLVMRAGRPVLVAPAALRHFAFGRAVVAWKEAPESRRAILDALPLLKAAASVAVVATVGEAELEATRFHLEDVVAWLDCHGVVAEPIAAPSTGDEVGELTAIAQAQGADLLVAGAFGHGSLREWVFGGVTKDLLMRWDRFALLSH